MKKLFFILVLVFLSVCNMANAKNIKFIQIAEAQYGSSQVNTEILRAAIKDINKMRDVDFVVFTGDNIAAPNDKYLLEFTNEIKKLHKPYYMVVGDKDISKSKKMDKETYTKKLHKYLGGHSPETLNYTFKCKNILFIVTDGAKDFFTLPNGYYNGKTLNWVEDLIKYNKNKKVVIIQHFPLANKTTNEMLYTANAREYIRMINNYDNVISVVSGHYDKNDEVMYEGVYYIVTPSLTHKCYKVIEIDKENGYQVFTSLIKMD